MEIPNKARILYQKGISASQKHNWDYAITLLTAVLDIIPSHSPARTNLRLAEWQKYESRKFPSWFRFTSGLCNLWHYIKASIFWHQNNWALVLEELEKALRFYPRNYRVLRAMARAAKKTGWPETVCSIYETMYILKPADIKVIKNLGQYYHQLKQPDKARAYYERALAIAPTDYEARKGLQDLAALKTISQGWEDQGTYRDKIRDISQADIFEKEARLVRTREDKLLLIKNMEKTLAGQLDNLSLIKNLAELYFSIEEFDKSLVLYTQIPNPDPEIRKRILDIKLASMANDPQKQQQLILEDTEARVKDFPSYLPLRYELGSVYLQRVMLDQAIGEFQLSVRDPKYALMSLNSLGLCFHKKGLYDLAINQFRKADNQITEWNDLKKEIIYNLGIVYEAMGNREKGLTEYKRIFEHDINFRDISAKIS